MTPHGIEDFAKRRDREVERGGANPAYISPEERRRRANASRMEIQPAAFAPNVGRAANGPGTVKSSQRGLRKEEHVSNEVKSEGDRFDTDVSSIGDTTMTSGEIDVIGEHDYHHDERSVDAKHETNQFGSGIAGFLDPDEVQGYQQTHDALMLKAKKLAGERRFAQSDSKADYHSTSPSKIEFHEQSAGWHGFQAEESADDKANTRMAVHNSPFQRRDYEARGAAVIARPPVPLFNANRPIHSDHVGQSDAAAFKKHAAPSKVQFRSGQNGSLPQRGGPDKSQEEPNSQASAMDPLPKRPLEPDYTKQQVKVMKYADLKNEDFEQGPQDTDLNLSEELKSAPLKDKLDHLRAFPENSNDPPESNPQNRFFSSLPIKEHEECGDIILGQFEELLGRARALRRDKRDAAMAFESEVEKRVVALQNQDDKLTEKLATLRSKGEDVIKART